MRKTILLVCCCIILYLTLSFASADAATSQQFDLTLTSQFKKLGYWGTASSIMEDESSRAAVSCSLLIDLASAGKSDFSSDNFADCILNPSNILTDGEFINVSGFFDHKVVHIAYDPVLENVSYSVGDAGYGTDEFNSIYEKQVMEGKGYTVYVNESEEMQRVFYILIGQD